MTSKLRPATSGWMPIETPQKDGTKAILYFPQDATDFDGVDYSYRLAIYRENATFPLGMWCDQGTNHDSFEGPDMTGCDKASHWFPLPDAPAADREAVRAEQAAELAKFKAPAETLAGALEEAAYSVGMSSYDRHKVADKALRQYKEARDA